MINPSWFQPPLLLTYDPRPARERMRGLLAAATFVGLLLSAAAVFGLFLAGRAEDGKAFSQLVFTAMVALSGTVAGFYFGASAQR